MRKSLTFLTLFLASCSSDKAENAKQPLAKINVIKPKSVEFTKNLRLYGTFKARDDVATASSLQGMQILSVEVETGENVKASQILAYLENVGARSELEQNKANLKRLEAELTAQEASLKEILSTFERYKILIKNSALSKQDYEAQEAKVATAKANIKSVKAQIAQTKTAIKSKALKAESTQNIVCHVEILMIQPPRSGPMIGATAMMTTRVESICAALVLSYRSRIIARASIEPVLAPIA